MDTVAQEMSAARDTDAHLKKSRPVRRGAWTHRSQQRFLSAFVVTANIRAAARMAHVARSTHYAWLSRDSAYRAAFAEATAAVFEMPLEALGASR